MASGIVMTLGPAGIRVAGGERRPEGRGRMSPPRDGSGRSGSWWSPIFGWAAEPDYIDGGGETARKEEAEGERERQRPARRFAALTEEKARELRMRIMETETFHDAMYHSAIASRLASDLPRRSGH